MFQQVYAVPDTSTLTRQCQELDWEVLMHLFIGWRWAQVISTCSYLCRLVFLVKKKSPQEKHVKTVTTLCQYCRGFPCDE